MSYRTLFVTLFFLMFSTAPFAYASSYDNDSLNIFSKIIPRFILMSESKNKIENEITICILSDSIQERDANSFADKIKQSYPEGLKNYKINVVTSNYANLENCQKSQLLFLFNTDEKALHKTLEFSKKYQILTVSYDASLLEYGVDMSLFLGRNIVPYINMKSILAKDIKLQNVFLRVSKIYNNGEGK